VSRVSIRKVLDKINERKANFRVPVNSPISNHVYRKAILAATCILLTIIILGTSIEAFGSSKGFVSASSIKGFGIGIYWNPACTNRTSSLHWGLIQADSNNTISVYVKNEGNSAASLWLGTSNWTPPTALDYISLNWNYSGQVLGAGQVIPLELTLSVSPTIIGITDFSFTTIITASEC
jgi:hypothetical protein